MTQRAVPLREGPPLLRSRRRRASLPPPTLSRRRHRDLAQSPGPPLLMYRRRRAPLPSPTLSRRLRQPGPTPSSSRQSAIAANFTDFNLHLFPSQSISLDQDQPFNLKPVSQRTYNLKKHPIKQQNHIPNAQFHSVSILRIAKLTRFIQSGISESSDHDQVMSDLLPQTSKREWFISFHFFSTAAS